MSNFTNHRPSPLLNHPLTGLRKTTLAVTIGLALCMAPPVYAEDTVSATESYEVPKGPLGKTLSRFAASEGIALSFDPAITKGLNSNPISGKMSAQKALENMLAGTGLTIIQRADGSYTLQNASSQNASENKARESKSDQKIELTALTVTGEKIERSLQDTLSSVEVITSEAIEKHADDDLQDIMARTPGVYSQSGNETWSIRGVPVSGFDSQGPATMNGAITVFVDGAAQTHRLVTLTPLHLWDVEQVEIFRGAQSTTQGRNSLAGAIVLKTKDPTFTPEFAAQTNVGNYGERGASFMANGGLVDDVIAGRLAFDYQEEDGYIRNETLHTDGNATRAVNARGKLLIRPNDKMDLLLTLNRTEHKTGEEGVNAVNGKPMYYKLFQNTKAGDELDQDTAVAKLDYYLSDNWTLTSLSTGTWAEYRAVLDQDSGVARKTEALRKNKQRLLSQELRLDYDSDRLSGFIGTYYATHTNEIDDRLNANDSRFTDPVFIALGDVAIRNMALFGELDWEFIDNWTVITGLRYDREENHTRFNYNDPLDFATVKAANYDTTFNELLPKLGLSYQFTENQLIGLTWQKGYRGGGINLRTSTEHKPYDPEYTSTYELAWRGSWLNGRLTTNANIYHTDWRDQQVELSDTNGITFVGNAASSRMQGIELSANYHVNSALELFLATSYNDTEYEDFILEGKDLSGNAFELAPDFKLTLGGNYTFVNGLRVGTDIIHQSDSTTLDYRNDLTPRKNDKITLVNFNADYPLSKHITVRAYAKNVFDRKYIVNNQADNSLDVGAPRTFGLAIKAEM